MSNEQFVPGQRWISNTEADLGLGIVIECVNRRVEIGFPAVMEQRTYAMDNAPLSRVIYEPGEAVNNHDGDQLEILERMENRGCFIYRCTDQNGAEVILPEPDLDSAVHFARPEQRMLAGQIDRHGLFKLRVRTLEHHHRLMSSPVNGLLGARVQLLPHQFHIAVELSSREHPRALLADEVGLGKTIEAGLVLHQRLISGRASRVLVVVPDNLVHQWLVELLRRFNLMFTLLDEARCEALLEDLYAGNPFESAQLILCPLSLLTHRDARLNQAMRADWDLMVVDEAHHLGWSPEAASHGYRCIEALSQKVPGVLLLTATPEQLGPEGHFARLRLLDPERYHDLDAFKAESDRFHHLSHTIAPLLEEKGPDLLASDSRIQQEVAGWLGDEALGNWLALPGEQRERGLAALISQLVDRHGTGRVLFRNTRESVKGFPQRLLDAVPLETPAIYEEAAVTASLDEMLHPEKLLGSDWVDVDPRVEWLVNWLRDHKREKALVICADAKTAVALEEYLNLREGIRTAAFHEGMSLINRDRAAAYFADVELGAQVLICSEIGSEGRNFQFASHLVLFDLPLSPDLLEQRIGRLDRIGQRNDVEIHVPYFQESAVSVLLDWYDSGLEAFTRVCASGEAIYHQFAEDLNTCLTDPLNTEALEQLITETRDARIELENRVSAGRDRLLELGSCDTARAEELTAAVVEAEAGEELQAYAEKLFDRFGVDTQPHGEDGLVLHMGEHMLCQLPGLGDEGLTLTFNRERALSREDIEYMSWEHPLLAGTMELILRGEYGNNSLCTLKLPPLPAGTLLLEAIYQPKTTAPRSYQLERYLPQGLVRVLVGPNGQNLAQALGHAPLNKLAETVSRNASQNMVRLARDQIVEQLKQADTHANKELQPLINEALERVNAEQGAEVQRLKALAEVNAGIHPQEVEALEARRDAMVSALSKAELKLDALRVFLVRE
ncbi:RNA polymerase-associated protein RapA [Marinobacterium sp. YM272]|uniref:RNA polymerase-associated protein RapA n=1 Tax=Marinobacterium sp. YM272 TaxID=3421654 RepID=UPI003D7F59E1